MIIDYSEWSEGVKKYLLTSNVFVQRNPQVKQLTTSVVLTFILEDHYKDLGTSVKDFFVFKHRTLKHAITGGGEPGPFYSDNLALAIHASLSPDGSLSLSKFTSSLIEQRGGEIIKPISI